MKRISRQGVLQVRDNQFLMLLLVMQSEEHNRGQSRQIGGAGRSDEVGHIGVDVGAVTIDLFHGRARQQAARRPRPSRPYGLVVRIKKKVELWMERTIGHDVAREDESFEEPTGMGQM